MSLLNRTALKALWITNYKPTQSDFANFFDSFVNITDNKVGKVLTVDAAYGVASGASREIPFISFSTPALAQTAASSGDLIIVMPGTYTVSNLGKNGVNWLLMPGVTFTSSSSSIFNDNASTMSFNVYGEAKLNLTNGTGTVISIKGGGLVNIDCDEAYVTGGNGSTVKCWGGSKLYIRAKRRIGTHINNTNGANYEIKDSNSELHIKTSIFNVLSAIYTTTANLTTKFTLECDTFEQIEPYSFCAAVYSEGGYYNIKVKDKAILNQTADPFSSTFPNFYFPSGTGEFYIDINKLEKVDNLGYPWFNNESSTTKGIIKIGNSYTLSSGMVITDGDVELQGNIIANKNLPVISIDGGIFRSNNVNINNTSANAAAGGMIKSAGTVIMKNNTIVIGGAGKSLDATVSDEEYIVLGESAVNTNIGTNAVITGGTLHIIPTLQ